MKDRIIGEKVNLDDKAVKEFFDNRKQKKLPYRYNFVNYQDSHPELVLKRDEIEKKKVTKFVFINDDDYVLDVGCGVGRWGDYVVPLLQSGKYIGVDYTQYFIDLARETFNGDDRAVFLNGRFQELGECLEKNGESRKYDKIFVNGVLVYINDQDLEVCFSQIDRFLKDDGVIYMRESVATRNRLTLNKFMSDELSAQYSVIYRSISEYSSIISKYLLLKGYYIIACGPTWEDGIDYKKETDNWFWILKKGS